LCTVKAKKSKNNLRQRNWSGFLTIPEGAYGPIKNRKTARKIAQNRNKFHSKPKKEIKALTDNALVGFRISLSVI